MRKREEDRLDWEVRSLVYGRGGEAGTGRLRAAPRASRPLPGFRDQRGPHGLPVLWDPDAFPGPRRWRPQYWANCAWDMLGIPAALHADALIGAEYAKDGATARLRVEGGRLRGDGGVVHFPLPLRRWYDDLAFP